MRPDTIKLLEEIIGQTLPDIAGVQSQQPGDTNRRRGYKRHGKNWSQLPQQMLQMTCLLKEEHQLLHILLLCMIIQNNNIC